MQVSLTSCAKTTYLAQRVLEIIMAFRADEAAEQGWNSLKRYYLSRNISPKDRDVGEDFLQELMVSIGPVVSRYPTWHPLVPTSNRRAMLGIPSKDNGYIGLDHTVYFVHGFITCPYTNGDEVLKSVNELPRSSDAYVTAEKLDIQLYNEGTTAVLVRCEWEESLDCDNMIPSRIAVPLMMEHELQFRHAAQVAERWENMRPYLLGEPHGARSSLFVNQETAMAIKKSYLSMVESGMFGPLYMGS